MAARGEKVTQSDSRVCRRDAASGEHHATIHTVTVAEGPGVLSASSNRRSDWRCAACRSSANRLVHLEARKREGAVRIPHFIPRRCFGQRRTEAHLMRFLTVNSSSFSRMKSLCPAFSADLRATDRKCIEDAERHGVARECASDFATRTETVDVDHVF